LAPRSCQLDEQAGDELLAALAYYAKSDELLAAALVAFGRIADHPEIGKPFGRRGARRFLVRRFPYSVFYRIEGDEIIVYAFSHHKRRPGYWLSRLP